MMLYFMTNCLLTFPDSEGLNVILQIYVESAKCHHKHNAKGIHVTK